MNHGVKQHDLNSGHQQAGYTLTEMMVVVSIIVIAVGIIAPMTRSLIDTMNADTARNTIAVAAANIRVYAARDRGVLFSKYPTAFNKGTAILFTPSGDIILMEHDPSVVDQTNALLCELSTPLYGYNRIETLKPINLSPKYGIVGIVRTGTSTPDLLSPPFAMAFTKGGTQATRIADQTSIYVNDSNDFEGSSPKVKTTRTRIAYSTSDPAYTFTPSSGDYDPDEWNPNKPVAPNPVPFFAQADSTDTKITLDSFQLPFEAIELVQGVVVFDMDDFRAATNSSGVPLSLAADNSSSIYAVNSDARDWILENGEVIFFSRYTGNVLSPTDNSEMDN